MSDLATWLTEPLRNFVKEMADGGTPSRMDSGNFNGDISWVVITDIQREIYKTKECLSDKGLASCTAKRWPTEAVILSTGATIGKVGIAKISLATKQGITGLVTNDRIAPEFLYYGLLFRQQKIVAWAQGSTFAEIRTPILGKIPLSVPSNKRIQAKIARILQTIDQAIEKTEALIEKYQQIKAGLMHDLFTRGIGADGKLRPPREEAPDLYQETPIGWIPREWAYTTVEKCGGYVTSGSRDWAKFYSVEGSIFIRIGNLTREHINFRLKRIIYVQPPLNSDGQRTLLEPGDILVSITADLGIVGVIPNDFGDAYINQHIALIRFSNDEVNPRYVGNYLQSEPFQRFVQKLNDSGAKAGLNLPSIRAFPLALADLWEQRKISERIDAHDKLARLGQDSLAKLKQQKSGLMHDLLTGKVQVKVEAEQPEAVHV
jgi:type I restriction enzyme S subunit